MAWALKDTTWAKDGCYSAARSPRHTDLCYLCAPDCTGVGGTGCRNRVITPPFGILRSDDRGLGIVIRGPVSAGSLIFTANGGLHLPEAPALNEGSRAYDITYIDPRNKKQRLFVIRPNATVGSPAFFINAPPADGSVSLTPVFNLCTLFFVNTRLILTSFGHQRCENVRVIY